MTSPFETPTSDPGTAPEPSAAPTSPPPGASEPPPGASPSPAPRRLHRSRDDRIIGGVCGGIAEWSGIDVAVVRIVTVLFMLMGHGLVLYAVAWLLLPDGHDSPSILESHRQRRREGRERRVARRGDRPAGGWATSTSPAA